MHLLGKQLLSEIGHIKLTVQRKLGEGGQGTVYLVQTPNGHAALKWYNPEHTRTDQKEAIRLLVQKGPPKGPAGLRFVWPLDVVSQTGSGQFGYLMKLIDTQQFATLGEVWAKQKPSPSLSRLCEISYQAANSYYWLHMSGYCYRDISAGNLMFDTRQGHVLICDNDNVGVNRQSKSQVWGTLEYMAPEIILNRADPSADTDLHSLAVLLFYLWVWHHPLHGEMEYAIRSWDLPAKKRIYGESPVFVFDPTNPANRLPNDPDYFVAAKRWELCPKPLQALFIQAFTIGLHEPARRVTEGQWQRLFLRLKDGVISCPQEQAENLWEPGMSNLPCWYCKQTIPLPPKLILRLPSGEHALLLTREARLLKRHVDTKQLEDQTPVGVVIQNPANPEVWGLKNLTEQSWTATFADGTEKEVLPQKSAPLQAGLQLNIAGTKARIIP